MKKVLFLIRDLGHGGAEKVLVNLVNFMDKSKFEITVMTLFDEGVNKQFLSPDIKYKAFFKKSFIANSHFMKLLAPKFLHKIMIREKYDIEIAYLEGPSARVISGCKNPETKLISWIHSTLDTKARIAGSFRNFNEAKKSYERFNKVIFVSKSTEECFKHLISNIDSEVLYNTNNTKLITDSANEPTSVVFNSNELNIIATGKITKNKGFDRLARITNRLTKNGYKVHTYILGEGSKHIKDDIGTYLAENNITDKFTFLGYKTNPYKYVKNADLFVCSSFSEGFSTAATEALIVGTPVVTTEVSGMKEMLGENNEYGIIAENNENALYEAIKIMADNPDTLNHYREMAAERGKFFSTENTVRAVENLLDVL